MKKLLPFTIFCLFYSVSIIAQEPLKYCGTDELRIEILKQNPKIAEAVIKKDIELEKFTKSFVTNFYLNKNRSTIYTIPVVFHVIHNFGIENIADAQILDGLVILNKTFRKLLADTASIVSVFKPLHADCEIEFKLATLDPNGNCTNGITRTASALTTIGNHSVKSLIQWPPNKYLNVYIVANAAGLAGHCVFPADADSIPAWDGIVIGHDYVGSIGTSTYQKSVAFAHECGHYLNLQHIWGGNNVPNFYYYPCADPNKDCNIDDLVADTPPTIGWQSCNLTGASCGNTVDNVQNTMDYSYCNRMFTFGQKARMQACLNDTMADRNNLWQPANLIATGTAGSLNTLCKVDFTSNNKVICQSTSSPIIFTNTSYFGTFTSIQWMFPGGAPASSTVANPSVLYNTPGTYNVTLKVINGNDSLTITKINYITVLQTASAISPFTEGFESNPSLTGLDWFTNSFDTINNWQVTNVAASSGTQAVMLDNFNKPEGTKDELISKLFNLTGNTSMYVGFKYAYAKRDTNSVDKLQLYMSNNCNTSWQLRINLTGNTLPTAASQNNAYVPNSAIEWKQMSSLVPPTFLNSNFRFKFVFTSSKGNNLFIDDINLYSAVGIDDLNEVAASIQLFPNPANSQVTIDFELLASKQLSISFLNVLGQKIVTLEKENYSEGKNSIQLNLSDIASGIYFIRVSDGVNNIQKPLVISK